MLSHAVAQLTLPLPRDAPDRSGSPRRMNGYWLLGKRIGRFNPENKASRVRRTSWTRETATGVSNRVAKCGRRYGIDVKAVRLAAMLRKSQEERSNVAPRVPRYRR